MNDTPLDAYPTAWLIKFINTVLLKYALLSSDEKLELLGLKATNQMMKSWRKVIPLWKITLKKYSNELRKMKTVTAVVYTNLKTYITTNCVKGRNDACANTYIGRKWNELIYSEISLRAQPHNETNSLHLRLVYWVTRVA